MSAVVVWGCAFLSCALAEACAHELTAADDAAVHACSEAPVVHTGRATYYTFADGGGSCMFDPTPSDLLVAAMNAADYDAAAVCGMTVVVSGPKGEVAVRIVDRCAGCSAGSLDLSPQAFALIADLSAGNVPITWKMVPSNVQGPVVYHFKAESNQWWTAVQVRNHRYPVLSLEYLNAQGEFIPVARTAYNYFVAPAGMGKGPFTFRVRDVFGHSIVDSAVVHAPDVNVAGKNQFPLCTP